jgi:hypothetical protein
MASLTNHPPFLFYGHGLTYPCGSSSTVERNLTGALPTHCSQDPNQSPAHRFSRTAGLTSILRIRACCVCQGGFRSLSIFPAHTPPSTDPPQHRHHLVYLIHFLSNLVVVTHTDEGRVSCTAPPTLRATSHTIGHTIRAACAHDNLAQNALSNPVRARRSPSRSSPAESGF